MLTKRAKYALKAMIHLAERHKMGPILINEISKEEQIPKKFLEAILRDLRNERIVWSKMGRGGGYALAKPPGKITLGEIIRPIDGPLAPIPCASETAYEPCADCPTVENCMIRVVMREVRDVSAAILDGTTLQTLLDRAEAVEEKTARILQFEI